MTQDTFNVIQLLSGLRFSPGSWDKRFVRDMAAKKIDDELTEKQLMAIGMLKYRYARQIVNKTGASLPLDDR